jgi:transposase
MDFAKIDSQYFCGVDLHSTSMYVTVLDKLGNIHYRRNLKNDFNLFKDKMKPFLPNLAIGVESTYNWYWLADGCHEANMPFYLGHALYMKAITGGKKKNDKLDSKTLANLMRTNYFPKAYPYPKEMRPTRDLLRRRNYYVSLRSSFNTHIQIIFHQHEIYDVEGPDIKKKNTRRSLIERINDPELQLSIACNLDMMDALDPIINTLEKRIRAKTRYHDHKRFAILDSTPGIGEILAWTLVYEIHDIQRFSSAKKFSSYSRTVKCDRSSNGKKTGGGNQKIGNPYLKWAIDQIIVRAQGKEPLIQTYYLQLKSKHGKRKARSIISHKFAVAIYHMLKNGQDFDVLRFVQCQKTKK